MKFLVQRDLCGRGFAFGLLVGLALWINITPSSAQTLAEGLDTTNLVWTTGGDAAWFGQTTNTHDGIDAARSGSITSNQTSWIETSIIGPATLSYWAKGQLVYASMTVNQGWPESVPLFWRYPPLWNRGVLDLAAGTNQIRWTAATPYSETNPGFIVLDEVAVLPPRPLSFTYEPGEQTIYSGEYTSFSASVIGTPPFRYQWRKDGTNIPGATNQWFELETTSATDAANYSIVVSNSQGFIISSNAQLTVLPPSPPFLIDEPESQSIYAGNNVYLLGLVDGSPPFTFQWRKDGTDLPNTISTSSWGYAWLDLTNISLADVGSYTLFVTNAYGSVETSNAVITVLQPIAPVITRHPRSLEVAAGTRTWLSAAATGTPDPTFTWTRHGDPPPQPPAPFPPIIGGFMPPNQRLFTNVSPADAGIYFATITNYGGAVTSREALLTVLPPIASLGSWWQGGEDVYVTNGLAFLAQGTVGLSILSVSNPATPLMLGGINTPGYANSVVVANGLAYVADGSSGLQIINVTNPSAPFLMGNCKHGGYATDLAVRSDLVFIAAETAGLIVVNASNPAAPLVISSNAVHFRPSNIAIDGNFAFLSSPYSQYCTGSNCWNGGLLVVDISNPGNPVEAGHHVTNNLGALCVRDQTVFAAADYHGVAIYSVTNPSQPAWIGSFSLEAASTNNFLSTVSVRDIQVIQDLVYVAGWSFDFDSSYQLELFVLDVRSLADPAPVGSYSVAGVGNALFADGNRVYATGTDGTFRIIETPFNLNPVTVPALTLSAPPGMRLGISGRRGFNYDLEFSAAPGGVPWQVFQTLLLTNNTTSISVTPSSGAGFFRLKQVD